MGGTNNVWDKEEESQPLLFFFNLDIILDLLWTHLSQCIIYPLTSIWKKYRNESCTDVSVVKYYLRTKNLIMICIVSVTTSLINCWTFGKRGMEIWKRINNVTLSVISSFVFCISDSFLFFLFFFNTQCWSPPRPPLLAIKVKVVCSIVGRAPVLCLCSLYSLLDIMQLTHRPGKTRARE